MKKAVIYENDVLKQFIHDKLDEENIIAERDFVTEVRAYQKTKGEKALLVTGLRSTGKTIGILQGIDSSNAVYICPLSKNSISDIEVIDLLKDKNCSTIVIDEYSWIKNEKDNIDVLAQYLAGLLKTGTRVIITGTESTIVHKLKNTDFIHRAYEIHTNYFSYNEYCRLYGKQKNAETMDEYLANGGVFDIHINKTFGTMRDYIQNAIINTLTSYYPEFNEDMVKAIVYTIFYECICNSKHFDNNKTAPVYSYKQSLSYEEFLDNFGIKTDIIMDKGVFNEVAAQLEELRIIVKIEDLRLPKHYRTYITNQALTCKLIECIYGENIMNTSHKGFIYEASVVCDAYFHKNPSCTIKYLEGRKNGIDYEIDFILIENKEAYLFECKHSNSNTYLLNENASLVKDIIPNLLGSKDIDVLGRFVVYQGEEKYQDINGFDVVYINDWDIITKNYRDFDSIVKKLKDGFGGNDDGNEPDICSYDDIEKI